MQQAIDEVIAQKVGLVAQIVQDIEHRFVVGHPTCARPATVFKV
jgi:hypothetical protein